VARAEKPTTRTLVYDAIRRYPGIHVRGLERELKVSAALVQYHLKKLEAEGYVEAHDQGGYARYYPTEKGKAVRITPEDMPLLAVLREEVPLHVALLLLDKGPLTHGELVANLGIAKSTVSYHLAKLAETGLVDRVPGTAQIRLVDRERVYRLLLTYRPTAEFLDAFADLWEDLYG
jgi:predicted transcriptional regulator